MLKRFFTTSKTSKYDFIALANRSCSNVFEASKMASLPPHENVRKVSKTKFNRLIKSCPLMFSSLKLQDSWIKINPRIGKDADSVTNSKFNFVQSEEENVLYCLATSDKTEANFSVSVLSPGLKFLELLSDLGKLRVLVPPSSELVVTKVKRDGQYVPLAVMSVNENKAEAISARNGLTEKQKCFASVLRISLYEALPVVSKRLYPELPPPYCPPRSEPSAPENEDEETDIVTDGFEPGRMVPGAFSPQNFSSCETHKMGKLLSSVDVIFVVRKLE